MWHLQLFCKECVKRFLFVSTHNTCFCYFLKFTFCKELRYFVEISNLKEYPTITNTVGSYSPRQWLQNRVSDFWLRLLFESKTDLDETYMVYLDTIYYYLYIFVTKTDRTNLRHGFVATDVVINIVRRFLLLVEIWRS